jgi:hypothetical protein
MKLRVFLFALLIISVAGCSTNSNDKNPASAIEKPAAEKINLISGEVFSSDTGEKLIRAEVWRNGELHSRTDLDGHFEILDAEPGDILRIRKNKFVGTSIFVGASTEILHFELAPIWELESASQIYTDISRDDWFEPAVRRLYENQILSATDRENFDPAENISRGELTALAVAAAGFLPPPIESTSFCDINPTDNFAPAIEFLFSNNWISGDDSDDCEKGKSFRPNLPVSRVETAEMTLAVFGDLVDRKLNEKVCLPAGFVDVPADAWFAEIVDRANCLGFIDGFADDTFRPDRPVNRAEIALIFSNALESLF